MKRREFLQSVLAGAALAAGWQGVSANGVGTEETLSSSPQDKTNPTFLSLKGFCANDESPVAVNQLNGQWMYIEFGPWNWNMNAQYNCKWALHLFDQVPNADDVAKAVQHPSYDGWWLTLNEPDLGNVPAEQAATLIQNQMQVVLSVDPNAKFCVGMGSQLHAPGMSNPWFPAVWKLIPNELKSSIRAFHTHYYVQNTPGLDLDQLLSPEPIVKYLKRVRKWIDRNAKDFRREMWVTEIGMATEGQVKSDPRLTLYPLIVQEAMNNNAERWAWYSMSTSDGYATLMQAPYSAELGALGHVFAGIVPGVYPVKSR